MTAHCRRCGAFVSRGEPGSILDALDAAIDAAGWIAPTDAAAVEILRRLAEGLDGMRASTLFGDEGTGNPTYTAQIALRYLSALRLTPEARGTDRDDEPAGDLVADLRAIAHGR